VSYWVESQYFSADPVDPYFYKQLGNDPSDPVEDDGTQSFVGWKDFSQQFRNYRYLFFTGNESANCTRIRASLVVAGVHTWREMPAQLYGSLNASWALDKNSHAIPG
jgi:hypothetical protein